MGEIRKDNLHESLIEELNELANIDLSGKQDKTDESLLTESKDLVGAINELFQSANNGKELIANAIGEPLNSSDTFSAMSGEINNLNSQFKSALMNNGVSVESTDKFKQLIDKLALLADNEGKGILYAEAHLKDTISVTSNMKTLTYLYNDLNINFEPTFLIVGNKDSGPLLVNEGSLDYGIGVYRVEYIDGGFTFKCWSSSSSSSTTVNNINCYAIGVGEEDTTLRDSLASILTEEGVSVTEEDDMASLISKVNEEFDRQVVPAGDAVASNVLSGKTFINSTGQTITGTMANNGTKTITPKASAQTLGAGYYDKVTINGDADLVAANIVSGKNIFGVTGTAVVQTTVKAGNTYYMVDNITMTALDSIRKYGGYLNASDYMVNNNNYILYKYNSPVTGKVRISYNISSESKHYKHQLKVYNKSGTVTWKSTELVITSGSIITNDISVEIGGLIEVCWLGNNYGQSTGVTTGPSKTKIENICITYSL